MEIANTSCAIWLLMLDISERPSEEGDNPQDLKSFMLGQPCQKVLRWRVPRGRTSCWTDHCGQSHDGDRHAGESHEGGYHPGEILLESAMV